MAQNKWTREELILAINLYFKTAFGKIHNRNPALIHLADVIGRSASAVSWKLVNFASLDPSLKERGIKGADHSSSMDKVIWNEFYNNLEELKSYEEPLKETIKKKQKVLNEELVNYDQMKLNFQNNLEISEMRLNESLRSYEKKSIQRLKTEFLEEVPNFPESLKNCLKTESISMISRRNTMIEEELQKRTKQLDQVLIRIGFNKEDFFEFMKRNNSLNSSIRE